MKNPVTPHFESIATPGAIVRQLEGRTITELAGLFRRAESATVRGWMLMSLIVGVALEKARHGDGVAGRLAAEFGCSERTINRLATYFSELIRPRLEVEGDRARFPLPERQFYALAIEGADVARTKPLLLLEEAEQARAKDPRFTARAFKQRIYGETGNTVREPCLLALVRKLANTRADAIGQLATAGDPAEVDALLEAASERLASARRSLRGRSAA